MGFDNTLRIKIQGTRYKNQDTRNKEQGVSINHSICFCLKPASWFLALALASWLLALDSWLLILGS